MVRNAEGEHVEDKDKTREQLLPELENLRKEIAELKGAESECRWVEAALRESEQRYKRLIESITDYIYTVKVENDRTISTTHGPGCLAVTGYISEYFQIYPHHWYDIIHEEDRKAVLEQAEKILSGEAVKPIEHRIVHKDGAIRWVRNTPVPHYDKEGHLISYDGLIADITERKKAEEVLKASKEYARNIIESSMDMIIAVDNDRRITEFNKAAQETFGYAPDEVIGKHIDILYADPSEGLKVHNVTLENGKHLQEIANRRKSGELFPSLLSSSVLRNPQDDIVGLMGVSHDITRRKQAEEALKESFAKLERAKKDWEDTFDSISDPLFIHDREMRLVRANRAYADAAGIKFKEFIGKPYYEVFPKMQGPFKMCLKAHELREEEFSCPLTGRIFKVRFYPIKDNLHSIHIMEDITEQRRAEKRLKDEIDVTTHLLMIAKATAGTSDVDKLMEQVVHCCQKILGCDICLSYLWDKESKVFRPCKAYGLEHELIPLFMTVSMDEKVGFVKEAMKKKEPVIEEVGAVHELPLQCITDIKTTAVIPLTGKKGPLGLIVGIYTTASPMFRQAQHEREKAARPERVEGQSIFTERDINVMQGIMHQVSVALEEARLYTDSIDRAMELSHKIETMQAMHEIDRNILSTLDPQVVLDTSTRMIGRVIGCDRATVVLVDKERKGFFLAAGYGLDIVPKDTFLRFDATSLTEVMDTRRPQYISNLTELNKLPDFEKELVKRGFISQIRIPLLIKGEVVGVLTAGAGRVSAFTPDDLSTLEKMGSQISVALQNAQQLKELEELFFGTIKSLSSAIDAKSPWTAGHSERVTKYALDIAKEMGLGRDEMRNLEVAGLLHDIGKIGTYDILLEKPGKLEPDEIEIVRLHPGKGADILEPIKKFRNIIPAIKHHHEFYDGSGHPDGLKGEAIPLGARILAVADTYDAMKADRPYRPGRSMEYIINEFRRCSGTQFDPKVVEAFLSIVEKGREIKMAAS